MLDYSFSLMLKIHLALGFDLILAVCTYLVIGTMCAMPNFTLDSNLPIIRLSNDVSFIPVSYLKHGQKSQNVKLVPWGVPKLILGSAHTSLKSPKQF